MGLRELFGPSVQDFEDARDAFEAIDAVTDATIYYKAERARVDGRKSVKAGAADKIVVEAEGVDDSRCLIPVMKEYEMVMTDFSFAERAFKAHLRFAGTVFD